MIYPRRNDAGRDTHHFPACPAKRLALQIALGCATKFMSEKQVFRVLYIAWLVAAGMLWFAIAGRHPYPFYTQLRWICCAVFIFSVFAFVYSAVDCYRSCKGDSIGVTAPVTFHLVIAALFAAGAVLFNPLIPFHFRRETWLLLDKISLGVVIVFALICWAKLEPPTILTHWFKWLAWLIVTGLVAYYIAEDVVHLYGKYALATASATATVDEMQEEEFDSELYGHGVKYTPVYKFLVDGKTYYGRTDNYDVGDKLVIRYNPANPDDNRDPAKGFLAAETTSLFGIIVIVSALCYWLRWIIHKQQGRPSPYSQF